MFTFAKHVTAKNNALHTYCYSNLLFNSIQYSSRDQFINANVCYHYYHHQISSAPISLIPQVAHYNVNVYALNKSLRAGN